MSERPVIGRRSLLKAGLLGSVALAGGGAFYAWRRRRPKTRVFIGKAADYSLDLADLIRRGLVEVGLAEQARGKRVLLKPNLVETRPGSGQINTHPLVVRGAIEAMLSLGAAEVLVAEGPGHRRDTFEVLESSGVGEVLVEDRIRFFDLNYDPGPSRPNLGGRTRLRDLTLPALLDDVDWVVSMPKLKTHHWAGVTLSMKNLFGLMPGIVYGWPKNILHWVGMDEAIVDIASTARAHLSILDGIIGMEGDGPIAGTPKTAGVILIGASLPSVDATASRIMGVDPMSVPHLWDASRTLGPIDLAGIRQVGERWEEVRTDFALIDHPAHQALRLR